MNMDKTTNGFTLIELLVVIAIISLLSSVVLASLSGARASARDTRRKQDLRQIEQALQQYYNDHGHWPCEDASDADCSGQSTDANGRVGEGAGLDSLLSSYMQSVPTDPSGPGDADRYYYYDGMQWCDGSFYAVVFAHKLETQSGNGSELCSNWGGEGGAGDSSAYHRILGDSAG